MTSEVQTSDEPSREASIRRPPPFGQIAILLAGISYFLMSAVGANGGETFENLLTLILFVAVICGGYASYISTRAKSDEERPERVPWMNAASISLWSGVFALMLVRILAPGAPTAPKAVGEKVTSLDGRFTIEVPGGWRNIVDTISGDFDGIAVGGPNVAVLVITDRREDLTTWRVEDYIQNGLKRLSAELSTFEVQETTSSTVPGRPARELLAGATADARKQTFLIRFYETPEFFIEIRAWGNASAFRDNEPTLRAILASFREVTSSSQ